jgi:cysteine desulfurase
MIDEPLDRIYLDYNATTPCEPAVVEEMMPYFTNQFGNASSKTHSFGRNADKAVESAREKVAGLLGARPNEIVFTSGATEAINLAIKGAFELYGGPGKRILTLKTEHKAVLDVCAYLNSRGADITYLEVDESGLVDLNSLKSAICSDTILCCCMWVNNETGVVQPVQEIGKICRERGVIFFTDATQMVGKDHVNVRQDGAHLLCFSGHKMYGPKGIGVLFIRDQDPRVRILSQIQGGMHERGLRSGTLNVPAIVGIGKAAELCEQNMAQDKEQIRAMRDLLERNLMNLGKVHIHGNLDHRLYNVTNLSFEYVNARELLTQIGERIALATGSACMSSSLETSHVLRAMGVRESLASAAVRISLGRMTTEKETAKAVSIISRVVKELRAGNPLY